MRLGTWPVSMRRSPSATGSIGTCDHLRKQSSCGHEWRQVHPVGSNRGPVSPEVPKPIAADYVEACQVLPLSAKASAALARRCLQAMLHAHGYKDKDLAKEVQQLLVW